MAGNEWFWRLVCSPDCDDACQLNCPACHDLAPEWERQGYTTVAAKAAPTRFTWSNAPALFRCWSRSASARALARVNPVRLFQRERAARPEVQAASCGCHEPGSADTVIKQEVLRHYSAQASQVAAGDACCGGGLPAEISATGLYPAEELRTLPAEALIASLGCGNPLARADLQPGEVVLDLGSGGGMDVFVAAGRVAGGGKVYGLDMSDEMLRLARANAAKVGADNVEFLKGDLESIPLPDSTVDVIISNCVVNLSPDKPGAFREAHRVLRSGGRLAISDIAAREPVPDVLKANLTAWAACIGGALSEGEYRDHLDAAGFVDVVIERDREYTESDAELAGLTPLLRQVGLDKLMHVGLASTSIRARKAQSPLTHRISSQDHSSVST